MRINHVLHTHDCNYTMAAKFNLRDSFCYEKLFPIILFRLYQKKFKRETKYSMIKINYQTDFFTNYPIHIFIRKPDRISFRSFNSNSWKL